MATGAAKLTLGRMASDVANAVRSELQQDPASTLRVNQLDARRLDTEMTGLLSRQFGDIFALWHSDPVDRLKPELDVLLQLVLWRYTVWIDRPTPGCQMQNLCYSQAGKGETPVKLLWAQKTGCLLLSAFLPWWRVRAESVARWLALVGLREGDGDVDHGLVGGAWRRLARGLGDWYLRALPRVNLLCSVCALLNFLAFLRSGAFSTLGDRLLGVQLKHHDPAAHRFASFELMNRVMVWNGLHELVLLVAPTVDLARAQRSLTRWLFPAAPAGGEDSTCAFCGADPVVQPMRSEGCQHVFCYFCAASEQLENPSIKCPRCDSPIGSLVHA